MFFLLYHTVSLIDWSNLINSTSRLALSGISTQKTYNYHNVCQPSSSHLLLWPWMKLMNISRSRIWVFSCSTNCSFTRAGLTIWATAASTRCRSSSVDSELMSSFRFMSSFFINSSMITYKKHKQWAYLLKVSGRRLGRGIFTSMPSTLKQKSKIQRASKFIGENDVIADHGEERPFSSLRVTRTLGCSLTEIAPLTANVPPSQASFTWEQQCE